MTGGPSGARSALAWASSPPPTPPPRPSVLSQARGGPDLRAHRGRWQGRDVQGRGPRAGAPFLPLQTSLLQACTRAPSSLQTPGWKEPRADRPLTVLLALPDSGAGGLGCNLAQALGIHLKLPPKAWCYLVSRDVGTCVQVRVCPGSQKPSTPSCSQHIFR